MEKVELELQKNSLRSMHNLNARSASYQDESLLLDWVNDRAVRQNAFDSRGIDLVDHQRWLRIRLESPDDYIIYIIESEDCVAVGQVRFEKKTPSSWILDYSIASKFRSKGLGKMLLLVSLKKFWIKHPDAVVVGEVKNKNLPSKKVLGAISASFVEGDEKTRFIIRKFIID